MTATHDPLTEVERSIGDCLATLDRYEAAFARVLEDIGPLPKSSDTSPVWNAKFTVAMQSADEVERLLAEQDGVWARWQVTLAEWHGLIKQTA